MRKRRFHAARAHVSPSNRNRVHTIADLDEEQPTNRVHPIDFPASMRRCLRHSSLFPRRSRLPRTRRPASTPRTRRPRRENRPATPHSAAGRPEPSLPRVEAPSPAPRPPPARQPFPCPSPAGTTAGSPGVATTTGTTGAASFFAAGATSFFAGAAPRSGMIECASASENPFAFSIRL